MIGQTVSHYRILECLGEGGMGVVYKAQDTHLDRPVALKFLPPHLGTDKDARARFIQEAKSASALDHTNICTIYDIDKTDDDRLFIAMSCYEGESLKDKIERGPLPIDDAVDYAIQIAQGLAKAHKRDIIHRDIKPGNVMVTDEGVVKIVDFGLAKMAESSLTKTGKTLGTAMYMSPEQARGETVDHRTDIWSLGVVLYEMLTGKQPFHADYEQVIIYRLMNMEPESISTLRPEVPASFVSVVNKLLQKEATERHADMGALLEDLRIIQKQISLETAPKEEKPEPSIAVLSFVDMSPQKDQEYFCDGMAEEIINALTKVQGLRVAARTSTFYFKGKDVKISEIGQELNIDTVLEGSVRKSGNRLRLTVQLVNVSDGFHLWSERYDRVMEDVFAVQDEIAQAIVEKLELTITGEELLVKQVTDNLEAYELYLKAQHFRLNQWELRKALVFYQQAVELDPQFVLAHVGVANINRDMCLYGLSRPGERMPLAEAAINRALSLDDTLADVYSCLGHIGMLYSWDWTKVEYHFQKALELDINLADAHGGYAHYLFWVRGNTNKAIEEGNKCVALDPLNPLFHVWLGIIYYNAGYFDEAISVLRRAVELAPTNFFANHELGKAYFFNQMNDDAISVYKTEITLTERHPWALASIGLVYLAEGNTNTAETFIDELFARAEEDFVQTSFLAVVRAGQGRVDEAFELLGQAYEERDALLFVLRGHRMFDQLRHDPRFDSFLEKMGFAT